MSNFLYVACKAMAGKGQEQALIFFFFFFFFFSYICTHVYIPKIVQSLGLKCSLFGNCRVQSQISGLNMQFIP